jgi:hypothetical protein
MVGGYFTENGRRIQNEGTQMSEIVRNCPLCDGKNSGHFDRREFRGHTVVNRLCQDCGLVYQSPRMTEDETAVFYQAEYRRMYQGREDPIARDFSTQTARAESLSGFILPHVSSILSHLDIGCSTGLILKHFQKQFGCESVGVEPGEAYRNYARQQGLTVHSSLEEFESKWRERITLISMSHVLEHLSNPVGYLIHLRERILDARGWLLLEVPNLYAHDSFEVAHLISFSSHTLTQTMQKAGFELIKLEQHGRPRSQLLPLYITALAYPNTSKIHTLQPEKGVAFKRWAGMARRHVLERVLPQKAWVDTVVG